MWLPPSTVRTHVHVSFRDADEPRPLANRFVASAERHATGWSLTIPEISETDHLTLDAAALTVARSTGIYRLLIVWSEVGQTRR